MNCPTIKNLRHVLRFLTFKNCKSSCMTSCCTVDVDIELHNDMNQVRNNSLHRSKKMLRRCISEPTIKI